MRYTSRIALVALLSVASLSAGVALLVAFVMWELRTKEPMLPMRFFRNRGFSAANGASLAMSFGMFGSIFLLTQFFQTAQGYSTLEAGLRVLPWTAMPLLVAPIAGALSDRIGGRPFMVAGLTLQAIGLAWIAAVSGAPSRSSTSPTGTCRAQRRRQERNSLRIIRRTYCSGMSSRLMRPRRVCARASTSCTTSWASSRSPVSTAA